MYTKVIRLKGTWEVSEGRWTSCVCFPVFYLQILNSNSTVSFSFPELGEQGLLRLFAHEFLISHPAGNGGEFWGSGRCPEFRFKFWLVTYAIYGKFWTSFLISQRFGSHICRSGNNTFLMVLFLSVNEVIYIKLVRTIFGINKNLILVKSKKKKIIHSTGSIGVLPYLDFTSDNCTLWCSVVCKYFATHLFGP